jgi:hypothetical protein
VSERGASKAGDAVTLVEQVEQEPALAIREANEALAVYHAMAEVEHFGQAQTAQAWRAIGVRLWVSSHALDLESRTFVRDRARDAHSRADQIHHVAVIAARDAAVFS